MAKEPLIDLLLLLEGRDRPGCSLGQTCLPVLDLQTAEEASDYDVQFLVGTTCIEIRTLC